MSGLTINLPLGTDAATGELVREVVGTVVEYLNEQSSKTIREHHDAWNKALQDLVASGGLTAGSEASSAAIAAVRAAMPDVVAAITAPKVQTIQHDDAGRIVSITTTAT